eukprot:TRINITY_DN17562_c0_g1_i1.p1 TRINITY_DN17562_c0_g1~~TRINITY_DN17562_c0_g1_i1.p1  ORF type:complete len:142 (-),score=42.90 TRINITY_DN17562_c0_g1_i1:94-519(-)
MQGSHNSDGDAAKHKSLKRRSFGQTSLSTQMQASNAIAQDDGSKLSRTSKKNETLGRKSPHAVLDSSPIHAAPGDEYRSLRREYLLLEEDSLRLKDELLKTQDAVKALRKEKEALLDELVVLEGLVEPSELVPRSDFQKED